MTHDTSSDELQFNRTPVYISLGLALALVLAVIVGAKVYFDRLTNQPVAMTPLPAPDAESAECASLLESLPDELLGHKRAELVEPAPAGAAAWQTSELERITLRCGVDVPLQYTEYSSTENIGGAEWLRVDDATPGSTLKTWYTTDRFPVVAVTTDELGLDGATEPVSELPVAELKEQPVNPSDAPLKQLAGGDSSACAPLMSVLPDEVAEGYKRLEVAEEFTAAWVADGQEPVVLRCGVAEPENYEAGVQLNQINGVPWFEDTKLINGSTSSTWFALGREAEIAASMPQAVGNEAVVKLTDAIAESVPEK
ncbi:DUF3515 domain-containing protein [Corynebacterium breve]|uniref:DUF3515 domain-containing protein n=1 Tax=Corynebacterium breve TaxID=3049799 RepID=A0ABY8VI19_9CORY|nr:DUF3515 domain-containing protein [Corynebacterium breve]WIM68722.1 DUF3515 domain-containing protein [Corynebacterium breve]